MSYFFLKNCLKYSLVLALLLKFQWTYGQAHFSDVTNWLQQNITQLGGRAVFMVYKDGQVVYSQAINNMNKRQQMAGKIVAARQGKSAEEVLEDFTPSTRQRIASCSKWLTAALAMTFVDEGKLKLQDSIGKYLPIMTKYNKGHIKVWHCLSHLTGIKQGGLRETLDDWREVKTMEASIERIARLPMEGEPGLTFHYGNAGLQIIAAILEKISGKDFETLFSERIAQPLRMKNTDFGRDGVALAAGGAWSTPEDYMHFLTMLLQEGEFEGKRILSKAAINEMMKNRVRKDCLIAYSPEEAGNWGYAFGAWVMDDAPAEKRSLVLSSPGLYGSFPWIDSKQQYCAFLFTLNLRNKGRAALYSELKYLTENAVKAYSQTSK